MNSALAILVGLTLILNITLCSGFEFYEHKFIGDTAMNMLMDKGKLGSNQYIKIYFEGKTGIDVARDFFDIMYKGETFDDRPIGETKVKLVDKMEHKGVLSYGDLVALAGDFIGKVDVMFALTEEKTNEHIKSLIEEITKDSSEIKIAFYYNLLRDLREYMESHIDLSSNEKHRTQVEHLSQMCLLLEIYYSATLSKVNLTSVNFLGTFNHLFIKLFNFVRGNKPLAKFMIPNSKSLTQLMAILIKNDMIDVASENVDHFVVGDDRFYHRDASAIAYKKFHNFAKHTIANMRVGHEDEDLITALIANAFADHYLSDRFASGHIRTPRLLLKEMCGVIGDVLSNCQHDEENDEGLIVQSGNKDVELFGDNNLYNPEMQQGKLLVINAVYSSLRDMLEHPTDLDTTETILSTTPQYGKSWSRYNPLFKVEEELMIVTKSPLKTKKVNNLLVRFPYKNKFTNNYLRLKSGDENNVIDKMICLSIALECKANWMFLGSTNLRDAMLHWVDFNNGLPLKTFSTEDITTRLNELMDISREFSINRVSDVMDLLHTGEILDEDKIVTEGGKIAKVVDGKIIENEKPLKIKSEYKGSKSFWDVAHAFFSQLHPQLMDDYEEETLEKEKIANQKYRDRKITGIENMIV